MKNQKESNMKQLDFFKTLFLLLFTLPTAVVAQNINFPDPNIKWALLHQELVIDTNDDNEISVNEAASFTGTISLYDKKIVDLTGIEYFTQLTGLDCRANDNLEKLDVSQNKALTYLNCSFCRIKNLDVSQNTLLKSLSCYSNQLTSLDISQNKALTTLQCGENRFPFTELYKIKTNFPALQYKSNMSVLKSGYIKVGNVVDFSSEVIINGKQTVFTWYNNEDDSQIDNTIVNVLDNGKFSFNKTGKYYCKMTNEEFPDVTLGTHYFDSYTDYTLTLDDVEFDTSNGTITKYIGSIHTSIIIPNSFKVNGTEIEVTSIGKDAFNTDLIFVEIPGTVKVIGEDAFFHGEIRNLTLNEGTEVIGEYAFASNSISSLNIPSTVKSIENSAFAYNKLTSVDIPMGVTYIGVNAFRSNTIESVNISSSVTFIGGGAFTCNFITSINGQPSDGMIYQRKEGGSIDYTTLVSYAGKSEHIDFIPEGVENINQYAFWRSKIKSLNLPNTIKSIGFRAFSENELTELLLPEGLNHIDQRAFDMNDLVSVVIPSSLKEIEYGVFLSNKLTSISIPNGVESIGMSAFSSNELQSVKLPQSLKYVARYAFNYNLSLKSIELPRHTPGYSKVSWTNGDGTVVYKIDKFDDDYSATKTPIKYVINYHLNEGVNNLDNPDEYTTESNIVLKEPTKTGNIFGGWYTNAEFTGDAITEIATGTTGDIELWAMFDMATAIKTAKNNSVKIYPNPATEGYFIVESKSGNGSVTVYALNGNVILSQIITQTTQTIEIPELPNGIYLVKIKTENGVTTKRLVVK